MVGKEEGKTETLAGDSDPSKSFKVFSANQPGSGVRTGPLAGATRSARVHGPTLLLANGLKAPLRLALEFIPNGDFKHPRVTSPPWRLLATHVQMWSSSGLWVCGGAEFYQEKAFYQNPVG